MKISGLMVLALLAAPSLTSAAYFKSAADISEVCLIKQAELVCAPYLYGVVDSIFSNRGELVGNKICLPDGITGNQVKSAFLQFLAKHPDFRKAVASSVIAAALTEAYPCLDPSPP
jgi:hypothetical protein